MAPGLTLIRSYHGFSKYLMKVFLLLFPDVNGVPLEQIMLLNTPLPYTLGVSVFKTLPEAHGVIIQVNRLRHFNFTS